MDAIQNEQAERAVIGCILLDSTAFFVAKLHLKADDFAHPALRAAWATAELLAGDNLPIDFVTLRPYMAPPHLPEVLACSEAVPTSANVEHYARMVKEAAVRRALVRTARMIEAMAHDAENVNDACNDAAQRLAEVAERSIVTFPEHVGALACRVEAQLEKRQDEPAATAVRTGFAPLDETIVGLEAQDLVLIGARPSMGKTALALQLADNVASREDKPAIFFSLEMRKEAVTQRIMAQRSGVSIQQMRSAQMDYDYWNRIQQARRELEEVGLFIDDGKGLSTIDVRAKCRSVATQHGGLSAVFIDYIQLMKSAIARDSRHFELGDTSKALKELAGEFDAPVVVLSQLSRRVEERNNKRPMLSDLRESGSLEEDADVVMLLYREDYYSKRGAKSGKVELDVAKQRNGPRRVVELTFDEESTRFRA